MRPLRVQGKTNTRSILDYGGAIEPMIDTHRLLILQQLWSCRVTNELDAAQHTTVARRSINSGATRTEPDAAHRSIGRLRHIFHPFYWSSPVVSHQPTPLGALVASSSRSQTSTRVQVQCWGQSSACWAACFACLSSFSLRLRWETGVSLQLYVFVYRRIVCDRVPLRSKPQSALPLAASTSRSSAPPLIPPGEWKLARTNLPVPPTHPPFGGVELDSYPGWSFGLAVASPDWRSASCGMSSERALSSRSQFPAILPLSLCFYLARLRDCRMMGFFAYSIAWTSRRCGFKCALAHAKLSAPSWGWPALLVRRGGRGSRTVGEWSRTVAEPGWTAEQTIRAIRKPRSRWRYISNRCNQHWSNTLYPSATGRGHRRSLAVLSV